MSPDLAALLALPDTALVPVGLVREVVAGLGGGADHKVGLTVQEVAEATDRAPSTVRTWCAEGRLPGARRLRGREWRIPRKALDALLDGEEPTQRGGGADHLDVPRGGLGAWRDAS